MDRMNEENLCSKLVEKIIKITENIPSDSPINVGFASNKDIRLISNGQKWIIVSDLEAYQHRLDIDRKRPSDVSIFVEIEKNHYILDNSNVTYVELESNELGFLDEYINNNQQRSIKFNNKVKFREFFKNFDKKYKNSDYGVCLTLDEYNDFINFIEKKIDTILHKHPDQYDRIGMEIKNKSLVLCFSKGRCRSSNNVKLSFVGAKESAGTKESYFVYPKIYQVIGFIKNKLAHVGLDNHVQFFDNKNELLKYFKELFDYSKIPLESSEELPYAEKALNYNESISITENTNNSYLYGVAGLSTILVPLLYNITTSSNKITNTTSTALIKSVQQDVISNISNDYDELSYELIYSFAAIFTTFIFFVIGFMCYKYYSKRHKNLDNNRNIDVIESGISYSQRVQAVNSSNNVNISIQEEHQISTGSTERSTSGSESERSTTPTGTDDQERGVQSTSNEWSTTSSPKSGSSSTSTGNEQQRLSSQSITTESSEKLSTSAESLRSNLEEVKVVESSQKPKPKPRSVYPNICQC